jgi:hypothetical protein
MRQKGGPNMTITDEKRSLFHNYAKEFEAAYLLEPAGQRHLSAYKKEREEVSRFWSEIKNAKEEGKRITDMVLEKLLPYSNTRHNREKNYRISIAPAITKDLKKWFENAGWQRSDNWDNVAKAIYELIYDLIEKDDWKALERFEKNQAVSKGLKTGFLTPTFYYLKPQLRIINNKTIDTVDFLLSKDAIGRDLSHYREYLEVINNALEELGIHLFEDSDIFDMFCHWMCDKRLGGYARAELPEVSEVEEGTPAFEDEIEPQGHWEAIYYIVKTGNLLGYKTYVADPSKIAFGKKLSEIAALTEVPPILRSASEISKVDIIWYKSTQPFFLFEVEDGGTMREALHRLYNAMAFDARFIIVCPSQNRDKYDKWVSTAPFKEFEERYSFKTYSELFDFYKEVANFISMRGKFLKL